MINPMKLMKLKGAWERFSNAHPRFILFLDAAKRNGLKENTVIDFTITTPEGKTLNSNLKLTAEDMELFAELTELLSK